MKIKINYNKLYRKKKKRFKCKNNYCRLNNKMSNQIIKLIIILKNKLNNKNRF